MWIVTLVLSHRVYLDFNLDVCQSTWELEATRGGINMGKAHRKQGIPGHSPPENKRGQLAVYPCILYENPEAFMCNSGVGASIVASPGPLVCQVDRHLRGMGIRGRSGATERKGQHLGKWAVRGHSDPPDSGGHCVFASERAGFLVCPKHPQRACVGEPRNTICAPGFVSAGVAGHKCGDTLGFLHHPSRAPWPSLLDCSVLALPGAPMEAMLWVAGSLARLASWGVLRCPMVRG